MKPDRQKNVEIILREIPDFSERRLLFLRFIECFCVEVRFSRASYVHYVKCAAF